MIAIAASDSVGEDVRDLFEQATQPKHSPVDVLDPLDALDTALLPPTSVPGALCEFNDEPTRALREHTERRVLAEGQQPTRAHMLAVAHDLVAQSPWTGSLSRRRMIYNHLREMETRHFLLDDTLDETALEQYERSKNYLLYENIAPVGGKTPCRCRPFDFVPARRTNLVISDWPSGRTQTSSKYVTPSGRTYTICLPPHDDAAAWLDTKHVDVLAYDPVDYFVNIAAQQRLLRYQLERQLDVHYAPEFPYPHPSGAPDPTALDREHTVTKRLQSLMAHVPPLALPAAKADYGPQATLLAWLQLTFASVPVDEQLLAEQARVWHGDLFCALVDRRRFIARVLVLMLLERLESGDNDTVPLPTANRLVELRHARRFLHILSRTFDVVLAGVDPADTAAVVRTIMHNDTTAFIRQVYRDYLRLSHDTHERWPPQPQRQRVFVFAEALRFFLLQRNPTALQLTYTQLVQMLFALKNSVSLREAYVDPFVLRRWAATVALPQAKIISLASNRRYSDKALRHAKRRYDAQRPEQLQQVVLALRDVAIRNIDDSQTLQKWLQALYDVYTRDASVEAWALLYDSVLQNHRPATPRDQWPAWLQRAWRLYDDPTAVSDIAVPKMTREQFTRAEEDVPLRPVVAQVGFGSAGNRDGVQAPPVGQDV